MKTQEKKTTKQDIFLLLKKFEKLIKRKPSIEMMIKEITMMGFKIRTIIGDLSSINFSDKEIVELLWSLGKFDDFFQKKINYLNKTEKEILLQYFNHLKEKLTFYSHPYQQSKSERSLQVLPNNTFEIEILRRNINRKKNN